MAFSGTVDSDFEKLVAVPETNKDTLIDFAATDFADLKNSLIKYMKTVYPLDYHNFAESDLGMMLVEVVAYMGAVMSFKADMLAHETFLRTSKNIHNVRKLMQLIGVTMRGPTSAAANAKLVLASEPTYDTAHASSLFIAAGHRTATITSPEDGGPLNYTLYKVVNGFVNEANTHAGLTLYSSESDNVASPGSPATVYTNLALLEGALVTLAGTFGPTEGQAKTIPISQTPVIEGSVDVFINSSNANASGAYTRVDNLYSASGPSDKIFEVRYDDDFAGTVVFGDGTIGISPPDDASYFVTCRVGGGSRGNIPADFLSMAPTVSSVGGDIVSEVTNLSQGTGGGAVESVAHAKKYAPYTFRRQDRLVTLLDYTVFANSYTGPLGTLGKAKAVTRNAFSSANTIDVYVLEKASDIQLQRATPAFKKSMLTAMQDKKMITDEIVIVDGLIRTLDLVVTIRIDELLAKKEELIKQAVRNEILNFFMTDNIDFGQPLVIGELNRIMFEVQDVRYATVDNLDDNIKVDFNEIIQLNNLTINVELV